MRDANAFHRPGASRALTAIRSRHSYLGVFAATLSSALASLVGAPRILQAVAADRLFPFRAIAYFGEGRAADGEPVRGYFLTAALALAGVAIGNLDRIAPIISNFFMLT